MIITPDMITPEIVKLHADILAEETTIRPQTRFADQIRWMMTAPEQRRTTSDHVHTRFGGGPRLSNSRLDWMVYRSRGANVSSVYLTFGKQPIPSQAQAFQRGARRYRPETCDFWMNDDGRVHLVTRDNHKTLLAIEHDHLEIVGHCASTEHDLGCKRAKAAFRSLAITCPGQLRDQHFFENCCLIGRANWGPDLTVEEVARLVLMP